MAHSRGASFVGRAVELGELRELLDERALVTIVGEGGVGKTRLAREVADTLAGSDWPVWWIDLGAATSPSGVRSSFEDSLGPVGREVSFEELIQERVPVGRCLMVIDNCEHVLDELVGRIELLGSVRPEMRLLATSRTRLGVTGEVAYRLSPLDVPRRNAPYSHVGDIASVALLIDRIQDVISDFSLDETNASELASIARHTEGVPLAIELVAAAAGALPLSEISRDLRESLGMGSVDARREPRRHRSLDASVRWSIDRLDPSTGVAFRRLGAFAESFRFDAAVRVISDAGDRNDRHAVRSFVELVEASLVRRLADDRFSLPMAVRTLAVDELDTSAEVADVRDRHTDAIADVVAEVMAGLRGAGDASEVWLRLLDHELPDIRAAIGWQVDQGRPARAAELVGETYDHAHIRGRYGEMFAQCRTILAHRDLDRASGARLAATASIVSVMAGRLADSYEFAVRAVNDADDPVARAHAHLQRAWSGYYSGLIDEATLWSDVDEALGIAREQHDDRLHAVALLRQGSLVVQARSIPEGRATLASVAGAIGLLQSHELLAARLFQTYGTVVFDLELDATYPQVRDVIAECRSVGHVAFESMALVTAGTITALWGDEARTDEALDAAERLVSEHELPTFQNVVARWRAFAHYRFDRPDTAERAERAVTLAEATDNAWDAAAAHWLLGLVRLRSDREAGEHLNKALVLSTEPGFPFSRIRAELALALVDLHNDDFTAGVGRVHEALRRANDHGDLLGVAASLDHLALFEFERGAVHRAGRFAGAADAIHRRSRVERLPCERKLRADVNGCLVHLVGAEEAERLVAVGRAQDTHAAVRLARRSRGRRGRPPTGWSSLTPTESEVADLAARGLSNPAIADRLVMTVNTVKTHLSHVYAKTGVPGRSGLAAEWARRPTER